MPKMRVVQATKPGAPFDLVERKIPQPGRDEVRIRVRACGICHSDVLTRENLFPGIQYPRVPGHEVAGVIDEVGAGVTAWQKGQRVGVGWHGWHCNECAACRRGDFINCASLKVTGIHLDGGYEEYMIAPTNALASLPEGLSFEAAAPMMCAGITTYNSLRHAGALPGDLVAVQGLGGLGHLGIQFANKFGYKVVAISRGVANEALAKKLGAHHYIDSSAVNPRRGTPKAGRRTSDPGHGAERQGDDGSYRRPGSRRQDDGDRCEFRAHRGDAVPAHRRAKEYPGMAVRRAQRFRGHAAIQYPDGRPADDRDVSARTRQRCLRPHDDRQGGISCGVNSARIVKPALRLEPHLDVASL